MPRKFTLPFFLSFLLAAVFSCEKTLGVDQVDSLPAKLVVVSNFTPDRELQVFVSASRSVLNNEVPAYIEEAVVELYRGETFLTDLHFSEEKDKSSNLPFYSAGSFTPEVGVNYTIEVQAPGFEPVSAQSQIPTPIQLVSSEITDLQFFVPEGGSSVEVSYNLNIAFEDPGMVKNYYHINLLQHFIDFEVVEGDTFYLQEELRPVVFSNQMNNNLQVAHIGGGILLQDEGQDGQLISSQLPVAFSFTPSQTQLGKLIIELRAVSESYYRYFSTLSRQEGISDTPLSDPVIVYDNIKGGRGIFAGFSSSSDSLIVKY